jgi:hypothetical protein
MSNLDVLQYVKHVCVLQTICSKLYLHVLYHQTKVDNRLINARDHVDLSDLLYTRFS